MKSRMIEVLEIYSGKGLLAARLKRGWLHASMNKAIPEGKPRAELEPKFLTATPDSEPVVGFGFAVMLGWVRLVLYMKNVYIGNCFLN
jgi:hypothetical protein